MTNDMILYRWTTVHAMKFVELNGDAKPTDQAVLDYLDAANSNVLLVLLNMGHSIQYLADQLAAAIRDFQ